MTEKRDEVHGLLKKAAAAKLILGDLESAKSLGERAYSISKDNDVPEILRQLAAYRLAHLRLRDPSIASEELKQVDQLLTEAAGACLLDPIGPLPLLYQLAVIQRLKASGDLSHATASERSKSIYKQARRRFESAFSTGRNADNDPAGPWVLQLQDSGFNLMEWVTYFLAEDYKRLAGLGAQTEHETLISGSWQLLSNTSLAADRKFSRAYAEAELKHWLAKDKDAIAFCWDKKKILNASWRKKGMTDWEPYPGDSQVQTFVSELRKSELSDEMKVWDTLRMKNWNYRKAKERFCDFVAKKLGKPRDSLLFDEIVDKRAGISVYVLVNANVHHLATSFGNAKDLFANGSL